MSPFAKGENIPLGKRLATVQRIWAVVMERGGVPCLHQWPKVQTNTVFGSPPLSQISSLTLQAVTDMELTLFSALITSLFLLTPAGTETRDLLCWGLILLGPNTNIFTESQNVKNWKGP